MAYNFVTGKGSYTFDELSKEIDKFNRDDIISNFYNATYIKARQSIDWIDFGANIKEKIQFLVDWKTTIVRATISTIHSVKGFDYACVFLLGMDWLTSSSRWTEEQIRKMVYVAVKRARELLFIPYCYANEVVKMLLR